MATRRRKREAEASSSVSDGNGESREVDARLGRCYELSAKYVLDENPDATLVHGTVQAGAAPPNPHAWVQYTDKEFVAKLCAELGIPREVAERQALVVYDPVWDRVFPPEAYSYFANCVEFERYDRDQAWEKVWETGSWGSWDERSQAARETREAYLKANGGSAKPNGEHDEDG